MQFDKRIYQALIAREHDYTFMHSLKENNLQGTYYAVLSGYRQHKRIKYPCMRLDSLFQRRHCRRIWLRDQSIIAISLILMFASLSILAEYFLHFVHVAIIPVTLIGALSSGILFGLSFYLIQYANKRMHDYERLQYAQLCTILDYVSCDGSSAITDSQLLALLSDIQTSKILLSIVQQDGFKITESELEAFTTEAPLDQSLATLADESNQKVA